MGAVRTAILLADQRFDDAVLGFPAQHETTGVAMSDLLYVGLTIAVFAVLVLLVKGVERFER